ncbi:MAG: DUF402 domain-containing protein, partial [Pyrinomonadaceae bacterium]
MDDPILVKSRKFDGRISKSWHVKLIERQGDLLICRGIFDLDVDHRKLGFIRRGTISYEFYWLDKWFNVFRFHHPDGGLRGYYCNVAMPPTFENGRLEYIDLDIDVIADRDLKHETLDLDEFEEHTLRFG